jgi:hypothetical protein
MLRRPLPLLVLSLRSSLPLPILALGVLLALALAGGALTALVRWRGSSPAWAAGWTHAWSEAVYRSEGVWLEFTDWLRSDRS